MSGITNEWYLFDAGTLDKKTCNKVWKAVGRNWEGASVDTGIDYTAGFGLFSGTVSYDYTSDEDSVIGLETSLAAYGASVVPSVSWNIQDSQLDTSVDVGYNMFGLDATYTVDWDISDMELTGTESSVGYTFNIGSLALTPSVTIPFDDDRNRGTTTLGLSVSVSFGSNGS